MIVRPSMLSSLSTRVYEMVIQSLQVQHDDNHDWMNASHLIALDVVDEHMMKQCQLLPIPRMDDDDEDSAVMRYNEDCVAKIPLVIQRIIAPLAWHCNRLLSTRTCRDALLAGHYFDWCSVDGDGSGFARAMQLFQSEDPHDALACVLLVSSWLERGFGAVYTRDAKKKPPALFRDLLESPCILQRFGYARELVRAFAVHPWGVNVRNVAWHGFVVGQELPRPWVALLICLCASLSQRAGESRPSLVSPLRLKHVWRHPQGETLGTISEGEFLSLATNNPMVPAGYEGQLCAALRRLQNANASGLQRTEALSLLVVTIEHGLRRAFCVLNRLEDRSATADSSVLYTTLDDLTVANLEDGRSNALVDFLGVPLMMALLDLFHLPLGPRIRDRVSHGEVVPADLAPDGCAAFIVGSVFNMYVAMMHRVAGARPVSPALESIARPFATYESVCHPKARARYQLQRLASSLVHFQDFMERLYAGLAPGDIVAPLAEPLLDVFRLRVSRHAVSDALLESIVSSTDNLGLEGWKPFAQEMCMSPLLLWNTSTPPGLAKKIARVCKECVKAIDLLEAQMRQLVALGGERLLKCHYQRVDAVPLISRVVYVIGRIILERLARIEKLDRAQDSTVPGLDAVEKFFTALYSFVLRVHSSLKEEGNSIGQLMMASKLEPIIDRAVKLWSRGY